MPIDASIPLSVKPPQVENPIQQFANLQALKNQQLQMQAGNIELQQKQMELQDQQKIRALYPQTGGDLSKLSTLAAQNGVGPKTVMALNQAALEQKTKLAQLDEANLKNYGTKAGIVADKMQGVLNAKPEDQPKAWQEAKNNLAGTGIVPPGYMPDQFDQAWATTHANASKLFDQEMKRREVVAQETGAGAKKQDADIADKRLKADIPRIEAEAAIAQNKLKMIQDAKPEDFSKVIDQIAPPGVPENAALNSRLKAQVNFSLKRGDIDGAKQALTAGASEVRQLEVATDPRVKANKIAITVAGQQARNEAATPTGGGLDLMAEQALNGQFTSRNPVLMRSVYDRAAQLAKDRGMNAQQTIMEKNAAQANNTALKAVTKQYETLKPFADMAEKNADILEKKMAEVSDLGTSLLNTPIRELEGKFGSTKVTAVKAALLPVQADFARILNSPTGAGELSDHARAEMQGALQGGATVGQIKAALDVFRTDARNRRESYTATIADLKQRSVSGGGNQSQGGGTAAPANTGKPPATAEEYLRSKGLLK